MYELRKGTLLKRFSHKTQYNYVIMKVGRKCKICTLKDTNPEAYKLISKEISKEKGKAQIKKLLNTLKKRFGLDVNGVNIHRHKAHLELDVREIKEEEISKSDSSQQAQPLRQNPTIQPSELTNSISFPELDPKHEKVLLNYRKNGYKNKEEAYKDAGYSKKSGKTVYELFERPEIKAAVNEMKAVDFINMKITGNQIIAGIGKVANYTDFIDQMYDDEGRAITNIKEWPEELRYALNAVEMTEDVMKLSKDDEEGIVLKRKFKFRFESHLKAKQELRKHYMEIQMYQSGGENKEKMKIYESIIEKLLLNQINPIAAGLEMGKHNLAVPDALKIAMQKVDPKMIEPPKGIDSGDLDTSQLSDEELDQIILNGVE